MKYTVLGKSDLHVSRICMGCMGFGDASAGQQSWTIDHHQTGGRTGGKAWGIHDRGVTGMAAHKGRFPSRGDHKGATY